MDANVATGMSSRARCFFSSTIGLKQVMGFTGLVWCGFLFSHMAGNLLLFKSAEAYNKYSYALTSNPLLILAEAFLVLTLLLHVINGFCVSAKNRSAKGVKPATALSGSKNSSFAVKTMIFQGVLILFYLINHLIHFKFGTHYTVVYGGVEMRDIYKLVVEEFQSPLYTLFYVLMMVVLGFHLSHGFYSSFQTLGFNHPRYSPWLKRGGCAFALIVSMGFLIQPVFVHFFAQP